MVYIVLEIQSNNESANHLINSYTDKDKAESKFHTILAAAATSKVPVHTAVLFTDKGRIIKSESYEHTTEK